MRTPMTTREHAAEEAAPGGTAQYTHSDGLQGRHAWALWVATAILITVPVLAAYSSSLIVSDIPWGDHLTLFRDTGITEGKVLERLFTFHNEHVIATTRIVVAMDYWLLGGANAIPAIAAILLSIGMAAIWLVLLVRSVHQVRPAFVAFSFCTLLALLMNGRMTWAFTSPILLQHIVANFFVLLCVAGVSSLMAGDSRRPVTLWALCLISAAVAAVSGASGSLALIAASGASILMAAATPNLRRRVSLHVICVSGLIGLLVPLIYAAMYRASRETVLDHTASVDLLHAARFAIYFPGGAWFRDSTWPIEHHPDPLLLHFVVLGFWLWLGFIMVHMWRRRECLGAFELFNVSVICFVVLTAAIGGLFRSHLSELEALNNKYAPTALLAWASLASLSLRIVLTSGTFDTRAVALAGAATATIILPGDFTEYRAWRLWRQQLTAAADLHAAGVRSDAVMRHFFPDPSTARMIMAQIEGQRAYHFRPGRADPSQSPQNLSLRVDRVPDHRDYAIEYLNESPRQVFGEPVEVSADAPIALAGWAADHDSKRPASRVELIVDEQQHTTVYGLPRPDVAAHFGIDELEATGFSVVLPAGSLPVGRHELRLRIVLADRLHAFETPSFTLVVR